MQLEARTAVSGLVTVDGRVFPLKAARIDARAAGGLAATVLVQEYANPHAEPLDVVYTLPLPADGAVVAYMIRLGERVVTGRIERREEARAQLEKALMEGRTAGLLEQERADTFTQTLGCLPPGVPVRVEIEVIHPCAFHEPRGAEDRAEWEYRFPTVVGVRYQGDPGRVPDAETLDAPRGDDAGVPARLEAEIAILDGPPERVIPRCMDRALETSFDGRATRARLAPSRLDRDLVVRWGAAEREVGVCLVEGPGLPGDEGRYGLLTIVPPSVVSASFPRDVMFLVDASGSMAGAPLEHAKRIIDAMLGALRPGDRFEILAFSMNTVPLTRGTVAATPSALADARARLESLRAGGGTEMPRAIDEALAPLRPDTMRQVVLLSDGYIGFEKEVIGRVATALRPASRLHAVGVGAAPNRTLTRGVSRAGRGVEVLVGLSDRVEDAAGRLLAATSRPVLMDARVSGSAVREIAPQAGLDVFAGRHARMFLELVPEGGWVEIEGRLAGSKGPWVRRLEIAAAGGPAPDAEPRAEGASSGIPGRASDRSSLPLPLGACFGRERVEDWEHLLATLPSEENGDTILSTIEALGLRHRIVTRRTSLVAVSEDPTVDPRDPRRRERLAVELPADVSAEGVGYGSIPPAGQARSAVAGAVRSLVSDHPLKAAARSILVRASVTRYGKLATSEGGRSSDGEEDGFRSFTLHSKLPRKAFAPDDEHGALQGRILSLEGDLLVVEIVAPAEGLTLPEGALKIWLVWGERALVVERDVALSSKPGTHGQGLVLRLALRLPQARPSSGRPTLLGWGDPEGGEITIRLSGEERA